MRSALNNPFTPGSDNVPEVWAGRTDQLHDWSEVVRPRHASGLPERGRTILGEPGLGKSTLVRRIAAQAEANGDWVTPQLRIPTRSDPLKTVAAALMVLADRAGLGTGRDHRLAAMLDRVRQISVTGVALTADRAEGPEPYTALTNLLVEIGLQAVEHGTVVLIHVDEIQNVTDGDALSQLLIALGDAATHEIRRTGPGGTPYPHVLPIAVYLTGLPDFAELSEARKGATFARRFATTTLAPLTDDEVALALRPFVTHGWTVLDHDTGTPGRVHMTPEAADRVVELCRGEPFLFQLAGEKAWYADPSPTITRDHVDQGWSRARHEARAHVERILERLPAAERDLLEVMARLAPAERSSTTIARALGHGAASQIGTTAQRLDTIRGIINRGRPYTFRHRAVEALLTSQWPEV